MLRAVAAAVASPASRATTCSAMSMSAETRRQSLTTGPGEVVLDTNVFVAAGFNPGSHSARLVEAVRDGRLRMVFDDAIHAEIEHVMRQIPRLSWTRIADL